MLTRITYAGRYPAQRYSSRTVVAFRQTLPHHAIQYRQFSFWSEFKEKLRQGVQENKDFDQAVHKLKEMTEKVETSTAAKAKEAMEKSQSWAEEMKKKTDQTAEDLKKSNKVSQAQKVAADAQDAAKRAASTAQEKVAASFANLSENTKAWTSGVGEAVSKAMEQAASLKQESKAKAEESKGAKAEESKEAKAEEGKGAKAEEGSSTEQESKAENSAGQPETSKGKEGSSADEKGAKPKQNTETPSSPSFVRRMMKPVMDEYSHFLEHINQYYGGKSKAEKVNRTIEQFEAARAAAEGSGGLTMAAKEAEKKRKAEEKRLKEEKLRMQKDDDTEDTYEGPTDLVNVAAPETMWDKRLNRLNDKFRSLRPFREWRKLKRKMAESDNVVVKKAQQISETVEDIKDIYETSQHPLVWKARDLQDTVMGESEMGWALGELMRQDEHFSIGEFQEEMEEYMIPLVTEALLKGDHLLLDSVVEKEAKLQVFASLRERQAKGVSWDTRILDLDQVQVEGATVEGETPIIILSYMVQQVNCVKDAKGEVVEGHETDIRSVYYKWEVRRDFENPDFDWKICKFYWQQVFSLT